LMLRIVRKGSTITMETSTTHDLGRYHVPLK
jgi:hypothetical protein